jgi:adenosylcobinamide-GDP ribazoletransferase
VIYRFLLALQFLTIVPVRLRRTPGNEDKAWASYFFPLVGLVIGCCLYVCQIIVSRFFHDFASGAIVLMVWTVITRGLHLDGVADVLDGFIGGRNREEILEIMRDSRIGAMGAIGVCLVLILKFAGICSLPDAVKPGVLLLVPGMARGMIFLPATLLNYARQNGTGKDFVDGAGLKHLIVGLLLPFLFSIILGKKGVFLFITMILTCGVLTIYFKKKINGVTGDCLGFVVEATEVTGLIAMGIKA